MNCLAHRDYSAFDGGMWVSIYPDRIELWNSGTLPGTLSVGDLKRPHPSLPPNPDLAHVFYLRGLIERIGRGTIKIIEDCAAAGLPSPLWKADKSGVTLTIFGPARSPSAARLDPRQIALLNQLQPGESLLPGDYHAQMEGVVSQRQAQRDPTAHSAWMLVAFHLPAVAGLPEPRRTFPFEAHPRPSQRPPFSSAATMRGSWPHSAQRCSRRQETLP